MLKIFYIFGAIAREFWRPVYWYGCPKILMSQKKYSLLLCLKYMSAFDVFQQLLKRSTH